MAITVRNFTLADLEFGMSLKEQAGWNQTQADWKRFLRLEPEGCFLAEWDGRPAGCVTVCAFGPVAWVAMMLVEASLRGRGLGRALMEQALSFADARGVQIVRLDATPLGQPLYESLGFRPDYRLTRYGGVAAPAQVPESALSPIALEQAVALDRTVMGIDRQSLLAALWEERPGWGVVRDDKAVGFYAARPGSRATHIGPCLAEPSVGPQLLEDAFHRYRGMAIFVDVPESNQEANLLARAAGLEAQRSLQRMTRGPKTLEQLDCFWASSGPEMG